MHAVDPWPAAPVLAELPPVAHLTTFDPEPLVADVAALLPQRWSAIDIVTGDGVGPAATASDWRTIPLRSIGGDATRTDPGGPDLADFADTPWLARLPGVRAVLAAMPGPVLGARLMALGPGAASPLHSDTRLGLPWGSVRLHVPVLTDPGAVLILDDETYRWAPGELWYADFTRGHLVRNDGTATRIHLVVDTAVTDELLAAFPGIFTSGARPSGYLVQPPDGALAVKPSDLACTFAGPLSFLSFEAPDGAHIDDPELVPMAVEPDDDGLVLRVDGTPRYRLVPVGGTELRFAGWTTERTIEIAPDAAGPARVHLRTRRGAQDVWRRTVPATCGVTS